MATDLQIFSVPGIPEVTPGANLGALIADAVRRTGCATRTGDVFVVAQKIRMFAEPHLIQINGGIVGDFSLLLSNNASTGGTCFASTSFTNGAT